MHSRALDPSHSSNQTECPEQNLSTASWAPLIPLIASYKRVSVFPYIEMGVEAVRGLRMVCLIPSLIIPCNPREARASLSQEASVEVNRELRTMCLIPSLIIPCNLREAWASLSQEALVRTRAPHTAHQRTLTYWPNPWFISHYTRWRYTQKLRLEYGKVKVCTLEFRINL